MMTSEQYGTCIMELENYSDRDAYVSDLSLSSMWGDSGDGEIPRDRISAIGDIWDAAHRTVKEISRAAGMTNRELSAYFGIPLPTVEAWSRGSRNAAPYMILILQEALGQFHAERKMKKQAKRGQ